MKEFLKKWDVLIIGGGNAGLCAAIMAAENDAEVLIIENSPKSSRGGNSKHTRNLRYMHKAADGIMTGPYPEEELYDDLIRVTAGNTNEELAKFMIKESEKLGDWMKAHGVSFQPPLGGTLHLGRTNAFFLGGGKALVNAYHREIEKLGVSVVYDADVVDIEIKDHEFISAKVSINDKMYDVSASNVVIAAGGFEANIPWLKEYWGDKANNFIIRGTPFNKGKVLKVLLDAGASQIGLPDQCHAVAVDGRAPKYDGGIVTRVDCVAFGIVVNQEGKRFYDEGEDFWPKRYAIWGRLVANQPDQVGHVIIDSKSIGHFMPPVFEPVKASTIHELSIKLDIGYNSLKQTIDEFNSSVVDGGNFDPAELDDCHTKNLTPPKSHWARPIDTPPYYAYSLKPGITFTYLGVEVDKSARMIMSDGFKSKNIFAAGEIMAGNVLGQGYLAGIGMTIGTVFGCIAGEEAAKNGRK